MPVLCQSTVTTCSTLTPPFQGAIKYCWHSSEAATVINWPLMSNVIDPTADPSCQRCSLASHTLEHWLQECQATASKRFQILGEGDPPLSILVTDQQEVIVFVRINSPVTRDRHTSCSNTYKLFKPRCTSSVRSSFFAG